MVPGGPGFGKQASGRLPPLGVRGRVGVERGEQVSLLLLGGRDPRLAAAGRGRPALRRPGPRACAVGGPVRGVPRLRGEVLPCGCGCRRWSARSTRPRCRRIGRRRARTGTWGRGVGPPASRPTGPRPYCVRRSRLLPDPGGLRGLRCGPGGPVPGRTGRAGHRGRPGSRWGVGAGRRWRWPSTGRRRRSRPRAGLGIVRGSRRPARTRHASSTPARDRRPVRRRSGPGHWR